MKRPRPRSRVYVIGLTGNIATGKSSVARMLDARLHPQAPLRLCMLTSSAWSEDKAMAGSIGLIGHYLVKPLTREMAAELADYLAKRLEVPRPEEASAARVLCELIKNQRLG